MKKIAIIMPHVSGRGGTENVVSIVMKLLQKNKSFKPVLYIFGGSENKEWLEGINYKETVFSSNRKIRTIQNILSIFFCMYRFIRKEKPDMVIATHSITCFVLYWVRKITRGNYPIVSWIHFSLFAKNVKNKYLCYADYHLAICESIKQQYATLSVPMSRIYVVNNPVTQANHLIRRPKDKTIFLYVGRIEFEQQKRVKDLLDALSKVTGEWQLEVVGDGKDLSHCEEYSKKLGINERINWYGWVVNPWEAIREVSALIMTSSFEGFGMVLAEAISHGVYCISSDCEVGPSDIIKNKINGELYESNNIIQLSSILQEIVNGLSIPDQDTVKCSIENFYIEQYEKNYFRALDEISNKWYKL
ncbi:glycosyltransferase [Sporolactobacillus sp. THM7-4]|nr:glycosyltransferase [Sporolactobacillus sp. THM7-4]